MAAKKKVAQPLGNVTGPAVGAQFNPYYDPNYDANAGAYGGFGSPFAKASAQTQHRLYVQGDENGPAVSGPEGIIQTQQRLVSAGFLNAKGYISGSWDDQTASAYREALGVANRQGVDVEEVLNQAAALGGATGAKGGGGGGGAAALMPNPDDVKALLNHSSQTLIGKDLDPASLDAGVQAFYNAYHPGAYARPDPTTAADTYVKSSAPQEVQAHGLAHVFGVFDKMLSGNATAPV